MYSKLIPSCLNNEPLYDYLVKELLKIRGNIDNIFFRTVSFSQIQQLLVTGNDRDGKSRVGNNNHEEDIMKDMGFIPGLLNNNKFFTWVSPFDKSLNRVSRPVVVAIYDGTQLEPLFEYKASDGQVYYTHGFVKFKNTFSQQQALIAIYSDIESPTSEIKNEYYY